jgi:hypothetical protein
MPDEELPFWLVNVPREQWPAACPDFLRDVSEKDKRIIGTLDKEYEVLGWEEVRDIVSTIHIHSRYISGVVADACWQERTVLINSTGCRVS